jgi:hypothetical protein
LRLVFDASWRIADAAQTARTTVNAVELLYKEVDRSLATAAAMLPLAACIDRPRELARAAAAAARDVLVHSGIELVDIAIRDCALANPFAQGLGKIGGPTFYAGSEPHAWAS